MTTIYKIELTTINDENVITDKSIVNIDFTSLSTCNNKLKTMPKYIENPLHSYYIDQDNQWHSSKIIEWNLLDYLPLIHWKIFEKNFWN
jgi:hypothetical protein